MHSIFICYIFPYVHIHIYVWFSQKDIRLYYNVITNQIKNEEIIIMKSEWYWKKFNNKK